MRLNVSDNSIYYLIIPTGLVAEFKKSCYKIFYIENKYSSYAGSIYSFQILFSVMRLYQECSVFSFETPIQKVCVIVNSTLNKQISPES